MKRGERMATAALALVGVPFRVQGRDAATGVDCVGVVAIALRAGGYAGPLPGDYRLRTGAHPMVAEPGAAFVPADLPAIGDVTVFRAGAGQLHLGIRTRAGLVHADAALRRVVLRPGADAWPLVAAWRLRED